MTFLLLAAPAPIGIHIGVSGTSRHARIVGLSQRPQ